MARDFIVYGEHIVKIRSGTTNQLFSSGDIVELGLTDNITRILPNFQHQDIYVDDFGNKIPAEILTMAAECKIEMTLVHYDEDILSFCTQDSLGHDPSVDSVEGMIGPAGTPMGKGLPVGDIGNRFIELYIIAPLPSMPGDAPRKPYVFPATYLDTRPLEIPIGTERSLVKLSWRALPYKIGTSQAASGDPGDILQGPEVRSSGAILWRRPGFGETAELTLGMAASGVIINPNTGLPATIVISGKIIA